MELMTIGDLARRAGVGVETVRFYQRQGLLAEPARAPGKRRLYTPEDLTELRFVRRCKGLGFALKDIGLLVSIRRSRSRSCTHLHELVAEAIHVLDAKKQTIELRRDALARMLEACSAPGTLRQCRMLAAFEERTGGLENSREVTP
jgi:MerR family mercuric resistance operon transcriptional regulator